MSTFINPRYHVYVSRRHSFIWFITTGSLWLPALCAMVAARGLSLQMGLLVPFTVKRTAQNSRGNLCEIFKFWSFLKSESANNVCKPLQFLTPLLTPLGGFCPPNSQAIAPKRKFLALPMTVCPNIDKNHQCTKNSHQKQVTQQFIKAVKLNKIQRNNIKMLQKLVEKYTLHHRNTYTLIKCPFFQVSTSDPVTSIGVMRQRDRGSVIVCVTWRVMKAVNWIWECGQSLKILRGYWPHSILERGAPHCVSPCLNKDLNLPASSN